MPISDAERRRVNEMVRKRTQADAEKRGDVSAGGSSGGSSTCLFMLIRIVGLLLAVLVLI